MNLTVCTRRGFKSARKLGHNAKDDKMLVSELAPALEHPHIQAFISELLDMQFCDVRAMLQLPRPTIDITPGCNFAITSTLCNLLSGISTTVYKPARLHSEVRSKLGSGAAFCDLIRDFFPYSPTGATDFPKELYQLCRNPLAHSVGLMNASTPIVAFTRIFSAAHDGVGWNDAELNDLEQHGEQHGLHPGIVPDTQRWTLHCDSFYLDVINLMRRLVANTAQMQAAEHRFRQGVYNWRH